MYVSFQDLEYKKKTYSPTLKKIHFKCERVDQRIWDIVAEYVLSGS